MSGMTPEQYRVLRACQEMCRFLAEESRSRLSVGKVSGLPAYDNPYTHYTGGSREVAGSMVELGGQRAEMERLLDALGEPI
jgi:hypothetical protein